MEIQHFIANSNKFYSAVTEYAVSLSVYLKQSNRNVIGLTFSGGPSEQKWKTAQIVTLVIPFFPIGLRSVTLSLLKVHNLVTESKHKHCIFWTFEGREHTYFGLHKLIFPSQWKCHLLVRVKGQSRQVKNSFLQRFLWLRLTDFVVLASQKNLSQVDFKVPTSTSRVQLYCSDSAVEQTETAKTSRVNILEFLKPNRLVDKFTNFIEQGHFFLTIGRFDEVKGYDVLLKTIDLLHQKFMNSESCLAMQNVLNFVILGRPSAFSIKDLVQMMPNLQNYQVECEGPLCFLESKLKFLKICILEKANFPVSYLMKKSRCGLIPSQGSETICRVAVEFFQNSTPVICSNVGALSEVVQLGDAFICYDFSNPRKWAQSIENFLNLSPTQLKSLESQCSALGGRYRSKEYEGLVKNLERISEKSSQKDS